jgi:Tfp pilus assembly protein PilN
MTVQVNLLPKWYRLRRQRKMRMQRWCMLCGALIAAQVLGANFLGYLAKETRQSRRELESLQADQQKLHDKIGTLRTEWQELDRRIQLANKLNRKHYWSNVLATIAGNLPERAMLTALETEPRRGRVIKKSNNSRSRSNVQDEKQNDLAEGLLISGVATDHEAVATLLRALNTKEKFGHCFLESTNRETFMQIEVVAFTIRTKW